MSESYQTVSPTRIKCVECGYDLTGSALGGNCPECGTPISRSIARSSSSGSGASGSAMTCMILGIIGIVGCQLLSPFAIGYYYKAQRDIQAGLLPEGAHTYAKTGLILGWVGVGLLLLNLVCIGGYFAFIIALET